MTEPRISINIPISQQGVNAIKQEIASADAQQVESQENLDQYMDVATFSPMRMAQRFKDLKDVSTKQGEKTEETPETETKIMDVEKVDEAAERFQKNNYELNSKTLTILRSQIKNGNTPEDVLKKVTGVYDDPALADEALEFLLETTEGQLQAATAEAKEKFNKDRGKEIRAGRNMGAQAREFSKEGLGSPGSLRELYRDILLNPREPIKLFDELTEKFRYPKLKTAITFVLHSLGSDLKSKGPTIPRGELKRLIDETRSLQGILGVFRFFQSRMSLLQRLFSSYDLAAPARLDFEILARIFVKLLAERFMNPDKIIQTAKIMGVGDETAAQIVIFSQMLDALKQISPRYFRDPRHRDEVLKAFIDTLEKLEEKLEEEEKEEKEQQKKKKDKENP